MEGSITMGNYAEDLIWVVGGTSGIGLACFELIDEELELDAIASGHDVDVRDQEILKDFVAEWKQPIKKIVYAAGVNTLAWSEHIDTDIALDMYNTNVLGLIRVLKVVPDVERVVVIGSDAAWRPMRASGAYCASKAALHHLVQVIAREKASDAFAINIVAPGMTQTGMAHAVDTQVLKLRGWSDASATAYELSQIPLGRRAIPEEIAEVVGHLLTIQTPYLNGAVIPVNGARY